MNNCLKFIVALICIPFLSVAQEGYPIYQVPFSDVKIKDVFWTRWLNAHTHSTIPSAIAQIRDSTSRISNFEVAAGVKKGKYKGLVWDDSDVYKVMEGIAYSLQNKPDAELEKLMDYWIDVMAKAQLPDGYLNTFFILEKNDDGLGKNLGRWTDMGRHEMYCAGHMIEAAVAYEKATGKKNFLAVAQKFADNMLNTFGPGKRNWVPLHEEPELALVKLYKATNEKKYLDFAKWLLEERGRGLEAGPMWDAGSPRKYVDCQTAIPVKDLVKAEGHAVRAMYLYTGMLDVATNLKDSTYLPAVNRMWKDAIPDKMYITGGIGARHDGEAFGDKFELPNKEAYCETCSSIGMVLWNSRMNLLYGDAKYADVVQRTLYNAALAGVSISGDKFFYTNPLESDGNRHRGHKYGIACCPSNMARFLPTIGRYVYMEKDNDLFINLFVASDSKVKIGEAPVSISQKTEYPWNGKVSITVNPESAADGKIKILIPEWCKHYTVMVNGKKPVNRSVELGYLTLNKKWNKGDIITLNLDMPVQVIASDPRITSNEGRRAVQRGPMIYCMEQVDNPGIDLDNIVLTAKNTFKVTDGEGILKGTKKMQTSVGNRTVTFVPYYAWENRESGKMVVWTKYSK